VARCLHWLPAGRRVGKLLRHPPLFPPHITSAMPQMVDGARAYPPYDRSGEDYDRRRPSALRSDRMARIGRKPIRRRGLDAPLQVCQSADEVRWQAAGLRNVEGITALSVR
jgi:hypothetical protein